jgi:hypothetical protein
MQMSSPAFLSSSMKCCWLLNDMGIKSCANVQMNTIYTEITPISEKINTDYTDEKQQGNRCNLSEIFVI